MPKKKRNVIVREELKFVESPKCVYHKTSIIQVSASFCPVTLEHIPAGEVLKKWVTPSFKKPGPSDTTSPTRLNKKSRRKKDQACLVPRGKSVSRICTTSFAANAVQVVNGDRSKFKPLKIRFGDREDVGEEVESVSYESGIVEDHLSDNSPCRANGGVGRNETLPQSDSNSVGLGSPLPGSGGDSTDHVPDISTPNAVDRSSPVVDLNLSSSDVAGGGGPPEASASDSTPQLPSSGIRRDRNSIDFRPDPTLQRHKSHEMSRHVSGRPRRLSDSQLDSTPGHPHLPPSITRNLLPIFVSASTDRDFTAGSEDWFRAEFFNKCNSGASKDDAGRLHRNIETIVQESDFCDDATPSSVNFDSREMEGRQSTLCSPGFRVDDPFFVCDTPESEHGLSCRVRQVKNHPKLLALVSKVD